MKSVKSIKKIDSETVYDVTVSDVHHYILDNGLVTHNSGLKYAASTIVYLSKKKEKDGTEVVGNIIHCKNAKSRLTIENKMVDVRLMYERGLDRYYGLLELALKYGIFKQVSTRIELPDGTKTFGKTINNDPEKYFTEEVMQQLDQCSAKEFKYGNMTVTEEEIEDE